MRAQFSWVASVALIAGVLALLGAPSASAPGPGCDALASRCTRAYRAPDHAATSEPGDTLITIGVMDGDERQVFGRIRDVVVGSDRTVYLLDEQNSAVSAFTVDGKYLGAVGGAGGGPGEFRAPVGLTAVDAGGVAVLDAAHRRITLLAVDEEGLHFDRSFQIPLFGSDLCEFDGRWFVLAGHDGSILHEVGEGRVVRSFGPLLDSVPRSTEAHAQHYRDVASRGRLACLKREGLVAVLQEESPVVRAFALTGVEAWRITLRDYSRRRWEPVRQGLRMAPDPRTGTAHTGLALGRRGDGLLVATLHEGSLANPAGALEWRVLDPAWGVEVERSTAVSAGLHP
jgi:hypothetical protein